MAEYVNVTMLGGPNDGHVYEVSKGAASITVPKEPLRRLLAEDIDPDVLIETVNCKVHVYKNKLVAVWPKGA